MASAVASKVVLPEPGFLKDVLASPTASGDTAAAARHLFGTGGAPAPRSSSDGVKDTPGKDAAADDGRRPERDLSTPKVFTGDLLDLLRALADDGGAASMTGFSHSQCGWWVSHEDGDAVQLKVEMPGLGKEHVKMLAEKDVLVVKGEGDKDPEGGDDKGPARYTYRIGLSSQAFKMDQIKAEMKNGVLRVTLPKIKDEERKDVFEIKIE